MLFGREYDNSLWCIIAGDKKNRNRILEFIKSIPTELLEQINSAFLKFKQYKEEDRPIEDFSVLSGSIEANSNEIYTFDITCDGELRLGKGVSNGEYYEEVFSFDLDRFPSLDLFDNFESEYLGTINYDIEETRYSEEAGSMKCTEVEYELIKTPFGYLVAYSREDALILKAMGKFINLRNMPTDLKLVDLNKFNKPNMRVRRRKGQ